MDAKHFDLVCLGAGPAGEKGAAQAAYFGKKVAVIDRRRDLGGALANTGVPGKGLRETALYLNGFRQRDLHGVEMARAEHLTVANCTFRASNVRRVVNSRVEENLHRHKIELIRGEAAFVDAHTLLVQTEQGPQTVTADVILIATGSRPVRPPIFP